MDPELPVLSLSLLASEPECGEQLARIFDGARGGDRGGDARFEVARRLRADARAAHTESRAPEPRQFVTPTDLEPEQQAMYRAGACGYLALFGEGAAVAIDETRGRRAFPELGIEFAASIGLALRTAEGVLEIRKLELRAKAPRIDASLVSAVALLAHEWCGDEPVHLVVADLLALEMIDCEVDCTAELPAAHDWLASRASALLAIAERRKLVMSGECLRCNFVWDCPGHKVAWS